MTVTADSAAPVAAPERFTVAAAGFGAISLWAMTLITTKAMVGAVDGLVIGLLRALIPALAILPLVLWRGLPRPKSRSGWVNLLLSALFGFVVFPIVFSVGLKFTVAQHGALVLAALPIFNGLAAFSLARRWPQRIWWSGAALALAGEVILIVGGAGLGDGGTWIGDLMVLAAAIAAGCGYALGAAASREIGAWPVTMWSLLIGAAIGLAVWPFAIDLWRPEAVEPWHYGALLFLGLGSTLLAYVLWYWALARGGVARVGPIQFLQPPLTVLLAFLLLGEAIAWPVLAAGALVLLGVAIARRAA